MRIGLPLINITIMNQFPHFLRNIYRRIFSKSDRPGNDSSLSLNYLGLVSRTLMILIVVASFFLAILVLNSKILFNKNRVLGSKFPSIENKISVKQYLQKAREYENDFQKTKDVNDLNTANDAILEALALDPKNPFVIQELKQLASQNSEEAKKQIDRLTKILEVRPDYAAAWESLGILYKEIGEEGLARQAKEKARNLNPDL